MCVVHVRQVRSAAVDEFFVWRRCAVVFSSMRQDLFRRDRWCSGEIFVSLMFFYTTCSSYSTVCNPVDPYSCCMCDHTYILYCNVPHGLEKNGKYTPLSQGDRYSTTTAACIDRRLDLYELCILRVLCAGVRGRLPVSDRKGFLYTRDRAFKIYCRDLFIRAIKKCDCWSCREKNVRGVERKYLCYKRVIYILYRYVW